ncbi:unnamed protein product [Caenorhabditis auriculariae]|uniref:SHSP domain-containing protein n=1 Tax=Caenorhabditis auriculariae TaxID=2777116 RepID=A0A8S1HJ12_9PELO|nr:unnamed protein product [Caenorhabditis auriculariae]
MSHVPIATDWDWPLQHNDGIVHVRHTDDKFEVGLDASFFTPKEIDVKVNGRELVIHLRHEERDGQFGAVRREVHRTYHLPEDIDEKTVKSHLNASGVLNITAEKKK